MTREKWVDDVRAYACILVAFGHLVKSMLEANLLENSIYVSWFIYSIYLYEVPIFFFASGYLFQKKKPYNSFIGHWKNAGLKIIDLGIPYVFFTTLTYVLKVMFSGSVNKQVSSSLIDTLFKTPINQMWYLYALIVIFMFIPLIINKMEAISVFALFLASSLLVALCDFRIDVPFIYLFSYGIWFVLGMEMCFINIRLPHTPVVFLLFLFLSIIGYSLSCYNYIYRAFNWILTLIGILGTVQLFLWISGRVSIWNRISSWVAKYLLQIYLLHTICAATLRSVLLKIGINNLIIHLLVGLFMSFIVPIFIAIICSKSAVLEFWFYPVKSFKKIRKKILDFYS